MTRGRGVLAITILLLFATVACAGDVALGDPRTMKFNPVEFSPPEPTRSVLENGMVVYLLEDHELPLVSLSATMRTGGWLEPQDKIGLAGLTGSVMRTGGGGGLTAEQIDEELEQFAIDINMSMGRQSGSASLDVLSKDLARGMRIFAGCRSSRRSKRRVSNWLNCRRSRESDAARTVQGPLSAVNL